MATKKSKLPRNIIILFVVLIVIAFVGKSAGWWGKEDGVKVAIEKVHRIDIIETVSASGKIQPEKEVKISPDVSGEIVQLNIKEGDRVKEGDLMVKIRPDIYEASLNRAVSNVNQAKAMYSNSKQMVVQAQANFKNTEAVFKRTQQLFKDKVVSLSEFDKAKADYESANANITGLQQSIDAAKYNVSSNQASVKESSDNLRKTTIFSPVTGIVSKLNVELGERVVGTSQMAGTEMMRIANMGSMEAQVDVNENDINRVLKGDTATISVDAFLGKKFKGVVFEVGSSANNASGSTSVSSSVDQVTNFTVKIRLLYASYRDLLKNRTDTITAPFKPGLSTTVDIQTKEARGVLAVPIQAVTTRSDSVLGKQSTVKNKKSKSSDGQAVVFIVRNGIAHLVPVKTGIQNDTYIQIIDGLKEGDEVITAPYLSISKELKEGQKVKIAAKETLFTVPK